MAVKGIEFNRWTSECKLDTGPFVICPDVSRVPAVNWSLEQRNNTGLAIQSITLNFDQANVITDVEELDRTPVVSSVSPFNNTTWNKALAKTSLTSTVFPAHDTTDKELAKYSSTSSVDPVDVSTYEDLAKGSPTLSVNQENSSTDVDKLAKTSSSPSVDPVNFTTDEEEEQALLTQLKTELPDVLVHLIKDGIHVQDAVHLESEDIRMASFETDSLERNSLAILDPSTNGSQGDDIFNTRVESLSDDVFETESDTNRRLGKCQRPTPLDQQSEGIDGLPVQDRIAGDISVIVEPFNNLNNNLDELTSESSVDTSFSSGSYTTDLDACLRYVGEVERREEFIISERIDCFEFRNYHCRPTDGDTKRDKEDALALTSDCNRIEPDSLPAFPCQEALQIPTNTVHSTKITDPMSSNDMDQVLALTCLDSEDGVINLSDVNIELPNDMTEMTIENANMQCDLTKASQNEGSVDKEELTLNETEKIDSFQHIQARTINTESNTDMEIMLPEQSTILSDAQITPVLSSSQNEPTDTDLETVDIYSTVRSETEKRDISINKDGSVADAVILHASDEIADSGICAFDDGSRSDGNKRKENDTIAPENLLKNHSSIDHRGFCQFSDETGVSLEHDLNRETIPNINAIDEFVSSVINYAISFLSTESKDNLPSESFFEQFALDFPDFPRVNTRSDSSLEHKEEPTNNPNHQREFYDNVTYMGILATIPEVDPILESYTLNDVLFEVPSLEGLCFSGAESEASGDDKSDIPEAKINLDVINDSCDSFQISEGKMTLEDADFKEDINCLKFHHDDLLLQKPSLEMVNKAEDSVASSLHVLEVSALKDESNKTEDPLEKSCNRVDILNADSNDEICVDDAISQEFRFESLDKGYDLIDSSSPGVNSPGCEDDTNIFEGTFEKSVQENVNSNLSPMFASKPAIYDLGISSNRIQTNELSTEFKTVNDTSSVKDGFLLESKNESSGNTRALKPDTLPGIEHFHHDTKSIHTDFSHNISPPVNDENLYHTDTDMPTEGSDGKGVGTTSISYKPSDSLSCARIDDSNSMKGEGSEIICNRLLSGTIQDCQGMATKCTEDDDKDEDSTILINNTDTCVETSPLYGTKSDIESTCNLVKEQTDRDNEHNLVTATHGIIGNLNVVPSADQLENVETCSQDVDQTVEMLSIPEVPQAIEYQMEDTQEPSESQLCTDERNGNEDSNITAHNLSNTIESSGLTKHDIDRSLDSVFDEIVTSSAEEGDISGQAGSNSPILVAHDNSYLDQSHVQSVAQLTEQEAGQEQILPSSHSYPSALLDRNVCLNEMNTYCSIGDEIQSFGKDLSQDTVDMGQVTNTTQARCNQPESDPVERCVSDTIHSVVQIEDAIKPSCPESPDVVIYVDDKTDLTEKDLSIENTQLCTARNSNGEDDSQIKSEDIPPLEIQSDTGKVKTKQCADTDTYHKDEIDDAQGEVIIDTTHSETNVEDDIEHAVPGPNDNSVALEEEIIEKDIDASLHAEGVPCKDIGIEYEDQVILKGKSFPYNESEEINEKVGVTNHRNIENESLQFNAPVENTASFSHLTDYVTEHVHESSVLNTLCSDSSIDPNTDPNKVDIETRSTEQCSLDDADVESVSTEDDLQTLSEDRPIYLDQSGDVIHTGKEPNSSDNDQLSENNYFENGINCTPNHSVEKCVGDDVTSNLLEARDTDPNVVQPTIDSSNTHTEVCAPIVEDAEYKDITSIADSRPLPGSKVESADQEKDCLDSYSEATKVGIDSSIKGDQEVNKIPDKQTLRENASHYVDHNEANTKSVHRIAVNDRQQVHDTLEDSVTVTTKYTDNTDTCKDRNTSNSLVSRDDRPAGVLKTDQSETGTTCPLNELDKECTDTTTNAGGITRNQENSVRVENIQSTKEDDDISVDVESEANRKARLLGKILKSNLSGELVRRPEYRQHSRYQSRSLNLEERQRSRTSATQDGRMRLRKAKSFDMEHSRSYPRIYKDLAHRDLFRNASSPKARMSSRYGPPVNRSRSFDGDREQRQVEHQRNEFLKRTMTGDIDIYGKSCEDDAIPPSDIPEQTMPGGVIDTYGIRCENDVIPERERRTLRNINGRVNSNSLDTMDRLALAGERQGTNERGSPKLEYVQYNSRNYPSDQQRRQDGSNRNTEVSADTYVNIDTPRHCSRNENADDGVRVGHRQEKSTSVLALSTCPSKDNTINSVKSSDSQMHDQYEPTDTLRVNERLQNGRGGVGGDRQEVTNVHSEKRSDIQGDLSDNVVYSKGGHINKGAIHGTVTYVSQRLQQHYKNDGEEIRGHLLKQDSGNGFRSEDKRGSGSSSKRCEGETKRTRSILTNRADVHVDRQANASEHTFIHDKQADKSRYRDISTEHDSRKAKPSHEVKKKRSAFKDGTFQVKRLPSEEGVRQGGRPSDPSSASSRLSDASLKDYINAISLDDVFYEKYVIPYESSFEENLPQHVSTTREQVQSSVERPDNVNRISKEKHTSFDEKSIRQDKLAKRFEPDYGKTVGRSNIHNDFDETSESRQGGKQCNTVARRIPKGAQQRRVLSEKSDVYENTRAASNQVGGGDQFSKGRPSSETHDRSLIDRHAGVPSSRCFNHNNGRAPRNNADRFPVTAARTTRDDAAVLRGVGGQELPSTYRSRRGKHSGVICEAPSPSRGQHKGRWAANDAAMRIHESSEIKQKDGPLSLTDAYGPMDTNDSHSGHALNNSTNHLSESMTSLSNRHAPAVSPSRQSTLSKQQSLQSTHSELNGDHRHEEGIKFERLKNLPEEDLMVKIREIIGHMERLEDYHRGDGMRIQKMLGDMYWDYTHMREMIGDCMADGGYGVVSMTMLKTLNSIGIFKNDDVWFPTYYTYNTMWNFTDASSKLAKALSENDAVRLLTLNCGHKPYINAIHSKNVYYVIKASLSILHNIARNSGMKHLFDENKTSETIMPFLESEDEMLKILATLTIANIVDEEENKTIISESGTIHDIVNWIEKSISLPRRRYKGFTPQELTEGLNKLAVNDSNKMRIVEEGALPLFLQMLQHDDIREQSSAARIVWTLSFDKEVRQKINENAELLAVLQKLTESTNKSLQMNCSGALWIIKGDNEVAMEKRPKTNKTKTHVFLSYAWPDKELVLNIRDKLRAEGYAIWIDIEKMGKATLETMTEAIENSAVVLVCMSEKYKQSPNCRTEAEYTFQLKKDYIPLMMQKKYRPDGWVGTILGAKLYFDFSGKYPFEKSFQGLLKELRGRGKVTPNTTPGDNNDHHSDPAMVHSMSLSSHTSAGTPVHHMPLNSAILNMGQEELIKWLRNTKLTECIPAFMEFDGRLLMQLKIMRTEAPEFFYQCLEKRLNMSLIEILKFTRALEELQ